MKIELAKKLKEQRKTKRLTIAEILSRAKIEDSFNPTNVRNQDTPWDNPNEPNDQPLININIQPTSNEMDESLSSNHDWGSSSSSELQQTEGSKSTPFAHERHNLNKLGARYSNFTFISRVLSPEAHEMLQQERGFEIADSEELFHQLYNPWFSDWKSKRKDYIKYEQLMKMQKKTQRRGFCRQSMSPTNETPSEFKQQKDSYYLKEIRTFDEVFKEIRKDQKLMKEKRE